MVPSPRLSQGASERIDRTVGKMSTIDMEAALAKRIKRPSPQNSPGGREAGALHTARAVLEENKRLIDERKERQAEERKQTKDFVAELIAQDQKTVVNDKAKELGRRKTHRELAGHYQEMIAEKEAKRAAEYAAKVRGGVEIQYFPFVEGENIDKNRKAQCARMRDEMRAFVQKQHEENPPRVDQLLEDTRCEHKVLYPLAPNDRTAASASAMMQENAEVVIGGDEIAPHMAQHPRFLTRARDHMSRRLHDAHVRKALEQKVETTKIELDAANRNRLEESKRWNENFIVGDAMRYDNTQAKAKDRKDNQAYVLMQIEEKRRHEEEAKCQRETEVPGYWGPDEKGLQAAHVTTTHCEELIKQMAVDQHRRLDSRNRRLRQERRLIDNSMAEMAMDRERDKHKQSLQREVLTTTWKSQRRIRREVDRLEAIS